MFKSFHAKELFFLYLVYISFSKLTAQGASAHRMLADWLPARDIVKHKVGSRMEVIGSRPDSSNA